MANLFGRDDIALGISLPFGPVSLILIKLYYSRSS